MSKLNYTIEKQCWDNLDVYVYIIRMSSSESFYLWSGDNIIYCVGDCLFNRNKGCSKYHKSFTESTILCSKEFKEIIDNILTLDAL